MASAHGKVIISGEHSAVYGQPALVAGIDLPLEVNIGEGRPLRTAHAAFVQNVLRIFSERFGHSTAHLTVSHQTQLPFGSGLGSSAAFAHAMFKSLAELFDIPLTLDQQVELVQHSEQFVHGNPSGVDTVAVVYGGVLKFQKQNDQLKYESLAQTVFGNENFFLIHSGTPAESTKEMVVLVKERISQQPQLQTLIQQIGELTTQLIEGIQRNTFQPELLTLNNRYLRQLGVVGDQAQAMIDQIEKIGGSAKVTGAGGVQNGSGMILAFHPDAHALREYLTKQGWKYYQVRLGNS